MTSSAVAGGGVGVAVDSTGTMWSINGGGGGVATFTPAGALGTAYNSVGLSGATALAIDGNSTVVIDNGTGKTEVLSNAGALVATTQCSASAGGSGVAIDVSGNVWVANPGTNSINEIIAGASPVLPLATAVQSWKPGAKP